MSLLRNAFVATALAGMSVAAGTGTAAAADAPGGHGEPGDNAVSQGGLVSINTLQSVDISPNFGCMFDQAFRDLSAQGLVGVIPVSANLNHLLEHANLNLLSNGNSMTDVYDYSCTANQGSSQAGNNSHGSTGAGGSSSGHFTGDGAGSHYSGVNGTAGGIGGAADLVRSTTGLLGQG